MRAGLDWIRWGASAAAGLVLCAAAGCAALAPAPHADITRLLPAETDDWNRPLRFTRGPGAEFSGDFHPGRHRLLYVSDRDGGADVFLQEDALTELTPPVKLAPHSARDRWPRFDPGGRRVLFVSTRLDGGGDIWLLKPARWPFGGWPFGGRLTRLTDGETADDQPCWHPDGRRIYYAASPSLGGQYDLWELELGGRPVRLTEDGAQMPDCSPDGRRLVFVSSPEGGTPDLYLMDLADRSVTRLTSGPELDLYTCWSPDGGRVLFARIGLDTNRDGRLDMRDASAIFSVAAGDAVEVRSARQLTSYGTSDSFPRPFPGGFVFTRVFGAGSADVMALGECGEVPSFERLSAYFAFAESADAQEDAGVHHRLLAWQNAVWAVETGAAVNDLDGPEVAARAWLRMGELLEEGGWHGQARSVLKELVDRFPGATEVTGRARAHLLALDRRDLSAGGAGGGEWAAHIAAVRALAEESAALEGVAALARLEEARTHLARRSYDEALAAFEAVGELSSGRPSACAEALLGAAEVYAMLGQSEAARRACLRVLQEYSGETGPATEAAQRLADDLVRPGSDFEDRLAGLRQVLEVYADLPVLPALAQNGIGDLFYEANDYLRAAQEYARTIERHPEQTDQVAAAYLAIGRIRTEQQDYERAVMAFEQMRLAYDRTDGRFYAKARRGLVAGRLLKAQREMDLGDLRLALKTYATLLAFDPSLAAAHRGLVLAHARLDQVEEAILRYRPAVEADPRDHVAHYGLALAYSYFGPSDWVGDKRATRRRVRIDLEALRLVGVAILTDSNSVYYHQLRGFLLSRLGLATGRDDYNLRSLDAYLAALGTARLEDDPANYPNVLFNVGEGYLQVDQPRAAYEYYRRAAEGGFAFAGEHGKAALVSVARAAMAAGENAQAADYLRRALRLQDQADEDGKAVPVLRRRAQTLDRLARALHDDGDYPAASDAYRRYAVALTQLAEQDPDRAPEYERNLLRAHRNLAVDLYLSAPAGEGDRAMFSEAYGLLERAAARLDEIGVVEWEKQGGPGLVTIDIEVGQGGGQAFDAVAERRLLYTYMALLSGLAGDHERAAHYLRRKADLYPRQSGGEAQTAVLVDQGVLWTQIGEQEMARGDPAAAARAFARAVEFDERAGNLEGEAAAAVALGRAVLRTPAAADDLRQTAAKVHARLIERIAAEDAAHLAAASAALTANLTQLPAAAPREKGDLQ